MAENEPVKRKNYGLSLNPDLMKEVRHLAIDQDRNVNDMLEEGMRMVLQKYKKRGLLPKEKG